MRYGAAIIACLLIVGFAWWATRLRITVDPAPKRMICTNNLKQIGLALHEYHEHHGTFPPTFIADSDGQPAHSWRVLILPFLDQQALYEKYRFDEPWNGPNNSQLAELMPSVYRCPSSSTSESNGHYTNYLAIIAPDSVMSGPIPVEMNAITDSQSSTILVTESENRTVHWMSPVDLSINDAFDDLQAGLGIHNKGTYALLADRSVRFIPQQTTQDEFTGLVTRSGGEPAVELGSHARQPE